MLSVEVIPVELKRAYLLLSALSLALLLATAALCAGCFVHDTPARTLAAADSQPAAPVESAQWLLQSVDGQVRVLGRDGSSTDTGLRTDLLPQSDREALAQGIPVHSPQALTALLEDLGS